MKNDSSQRKRCFIVIEPDPLIGLDLAGILASGFHDAELKLFRSGAEAHSYLAAAPAPVSVVANSRVLSSALAPVLRDHVAPQGDVVIIGTAPQPDFPAVVIEKPFTSQMILSIFQGGGAEKRK